jgi:hypothetical protein
MDGDRPKHVDIMQEHASSRKVEIRSKDMRRMILLLGLLALLGCRDVVGPFESRKPERVDDPRYTIEEQERRGRDRLAYPSNGGPPTGAEVPANYGR